MRILRSVKQLVREAIEAGGELKRTKDSRYIRFATGRECAAKDLTIEIIEENRERLPVERCAILVRMSGEDFARFEKSGSAVEILNPTLIRVECQDSKARLDAVIVGRSTTNEGIWLSLRRAD